MQIIFLTPAYPPLPGGGERYVASLAKHLSQLGCEITVVTSVATRESDFWEGSRETETRRHGEGEIWRLPLKGWRGGRRALLVWRKAMVVLSALPVDTTGLLQRMAQRIPPIVGLDKQLRQFPQPDVIHAFNISWEAAMVAGWCYAQERNIPFVVTPFAHFGDNPTGRVARNSMMRHQRRVLESADSVLTLTDHEIEGFKAWNVHPKHVESIGGGIDLPYSVFGIRYSDYVLPDKFVLFIGRANRDKGAIDAAKAVLKIGAQLVLMGQMTEEFEGFYGGLSSAEKTHIHHLGIVSEANKHAILAASSLLVLPSRSESFGIVLLEAWAHGKPVIGANAGGIPYLIQDNHDGFLIPYGDVTALADKISYLLNNKEVAQLLGTNGNNNLTTIYNWGTVAKRVKSVYASIIS